MVAYSFRKRFVNPICIGLDVPCMVDELTLSEPKRQTIRADRKRHAYPGEVIQLYCGMRTRSCFLIGQAICRDVCSITLDFGRGEMRLDYGHSTSYGRDSFARLDGFASWNEMREFWREEHPGVDRFTGVLITWRPLSSGEVRDVEPEGGRPPRAGREADARRPDVRRHRRSG